MYRVLEMNSSGNCSTALRGVCPCRKVSQVQEEASSNGLVGGNIVGESKAVWVALDCVGLEVLSWGVKEQILSPELCFPFLDC